MGRHLERGAGGHLVAEDGGHLALDDQEASCDEDTWATLPANISIAGYIDGDITLGEAACNAGCSPWAGPPIWDGSMTRVGLIGPLCHPGPPGGPCIWMAMDGTQWRWSVDGQQTGVRQSWPGPECPPGGHGRPYVFFSTFNCRWQFSVYCRPNVWGYLAYKVTGWDTPLGTYTRQPECCTAPATVTIV